jgi:hypothetical protein
MVPEEAVKVLVDLKRDAPLSLPYVTELNAQLGIRVRDGE